MIFKKETFSNFCGKSVGKSPLCGDQSVDPLFHSRMFYIPRIPAKSRIGFHTSLFKQILTGFLLGDGWIELHGSGARLGISLTEKFIDVAKWYKLLLYGLGYIQNHELGPALKRSNNTKSYYQIRTFSFESLIKYRNIWYSGKEKTIPKNIEELLTPLCLAIWVMGDGSGIEHGGFKLSSHSFSKQDNEFLCDLLLKMYGIKANVLSEKSYFYIRIWKRSVPILHNLVMPYMLPSCYYKFRFFKKSSI
jgi:hypothetical protein